MHDLGIALICLTLFSLAINILPSAFSFAKFSIEWFKLARKKLSDKIKRAEN